jgi:hypothetical protein
VVDIILAMKKENRGYSPGMISRMLKSQTEIRFFFPWSNRRYPTWA